MLTSIDTVAIYVHDWAAAVSWYEDVLGVEILDLQEDAEDGYRLATIADPEGNELNLCAPVQSA
jgi:predicted enzyme related to lactoylglutathione lyase